MSALGQDLRYAFRTLGRTPAFTAVAILTLALGIGATTVIFSVVHGVLMKPLPYRDPGRLVNIWVDLGVGNQSLPAVSPLDYLDYRERATLFEGFAAATGGAAVGATGALAGTKTLETQRVDVTPVAANFFQLFGVDPVLGRHFLAAEEKPGSPQVAILSHRLWKRRFAADPCDRRPAASSSTASITPSSASCRRASRCGSRRRRFSSPTPRSGSRCATTTRPRRRATSRPSRSSAG